MPLYVPGDATAVDVMAGKKFSAGALYNAVGTYTPPAVSPNWGSKVFATFAPTIMGNQLYWDISTTIYSNKVLLSLVICLDSSSTTASHVTWSDIPAADLFLQGAWQVNIGTGLNVDNYVRANGRRLKATVENVVYNPSTGALSFRYRFLAGTPSTLSYTESGTNFVLYFGYL